MSWNSLSLCKLATPYQWRALGASVLSGSSSPFSSSSSSSSSSLFNMSVCGNGLFGKSCHRFLKFYSSFPSRARGTYDLQGKEAQVLRHVEEVCRRWACRYGFSSEIITPLIEKENLFRHGLGDFSDVVMKEMFLLQQQEQLVSSTLRPTRERLVLRPEGTMGVLRALSETFESHPLPMKVHYSGQMYRYERPQFGRSREFWQFGVEAVGSPPDDITSEMETILSAHRILTEIFSSASSDNLPTLHINTLGDSNDKLSYSNALSTFFHENIKFLSHDSQTRLARGNPLRILDSKNSMDQALLSSDQLPRPENYFSEKTEAQFQQTLSLLDDLKIPHVIDRNLVRGLDYYCHTVFEFLHQRDSPDDEVGKVALIAGGRYQSPNGDMVGVGWAAGMSRISSVIQNCEMSTDRPVALIYSVDNDKERKEGMKVAEQLRVEGFNVTQSKSKGFKKQLKRALNQNAFAVVFVGSNEIEKKQLSIKNLDSETQFEVRWEMDTLFSALRDLQKKK